MRIGRTTAATSSVLAGIGALHFAWGRGSTFPFKTHEALSDTVIGFDVQPSRAACNGIAGLLLAAAGLVAGLPTRGSFVRRSGVKVIGATLMTRSILGLTGKIELISKGSNSAKFRAMDRRLYSPLCLALSCGAFNALRD